MTLKSKVCSFLSLGGGFVAGMWFIGLGSA